MEVIKCIFPKYFSQFLDYGGTPTGAKYERESIAKRAFVDGAAVRCAG